MPKMPPPPSPWSLAVSLLTPHLPPVLRKPLEAVQKAMSFGGQALKSGAFRRKVRMDLTKVHRKWVNWQFQQGAQYARKVSRRYQKRRQNLSAQASRMVPLVSAVLSRMGASPFNTSLIGTHGLGATIAGQTTARSLATAARGLHNVVGVLARYTPAGVIAPATMARWTASLSRAASTFSSLGFHSTATAAAARFGAKVGPVVLDAATLGVSLARSLPSILMGAASGLGKAAFAALGVGNFARMMAERSVGSMSDLAGPSAGIGLSLSLLNIRDHYRRMRMGNELSDEFRDLTEWTDRSREAWYPIDVWRRRAGMWAGRAWAGVSTGAARFLRGAGTAVAGIGSWAFNQVAGAIGGDNAFGGPVTPAGLMGALPNVGNVTSVLTRGLVIGLAVGGAFAAIPGAGPLMGLVAGGIAAGLGTAGAAIWDYFNPKKDTPGETPPWHTGIREFVGDMIGDPARPFNNPRIPPKPTATGWA